MFHPPTRKSSIVAFPYMQRACHCRQITARSTDCCRKQAPDKHHAAARLEAGSGRRKQSRQLLPLETGNLRPRNGGKMPPVRFLPNAASPRTGGILPPPARW